MNHLQLKFFLAGACCFLLLLAAAPVLADQVVMTNGDRITGTVIKVDQGVVTMKTSYSDALELAEDQVESIVTDQPVTVRMEDGEVLTGTLRQEEGQLRIDAGTGRGPTTLAWKRIASVNVPPPPPWTWSGNLFFGGSHLSGNTDRASLNFGFDALRKSAKDRYSLSFLYNYAQEDGDLTSRDYFGSIKYDYFFTEKVYGYLVVEMLKDEFKDLNLRATAGPGAGYQVWDEEHRSLAFDAGVSYFTEDRIVGEDDQWLTGRAGAKFRYRLLEGVEFTDNLTLFPSLESFNEFTARNEAALTTTITGPWSLRLSNIWDYDSEPGPGIKKSDVKTGANLQYSF